MKEAKLKEPRFESDSFFHVVFYRNPEYSLKSLNDTGVEKVTENQKKILDILSRKGSTTIAEISADIGISERKIKVNIAKMKIKGQLRRIGPDKGGYWEVLK